jgi:hypothetical protein
MEVPMESNHNTPLPGKTLTKLATLLLAAVSLSACLVAPDRGDRGGWGRHHQWKDNRDWNNGPGWPHHHGDWNGQH